MKTREVIIIFGKTGSGKSYHAKKIISGFSRVVILDPMAEYEGGLIFDDFESLTNYYLENTPEDFKFICRFTNDMDINFLFKMLFEVKDLLLVCEEAEIYISPFSKQGNFLRLIRYGRHSEISLLLIARRTAELSKDVRAQVTKLVSFEQTEPDDLANMEKLGLFELDNMGSFEYREITP